MSPNITNVSRRGFLKGMASAGALVLSVRLVPDYLWAAEAMPGTLAERATLHPNIFVGIDSDGTVHIVAHRSEMGTGSRTALPLVLADELDADWKRVRIEQAIGDARYGSQDTDGSQSVREFYAVMREAGATARAMLKQAAAQQWKVPVEECESGLHCIVHRGSGRKGDYGELAALAAALPVPKKEDLEYKPKSAWRYVGKGASAYDLADLCTGRAQFGMDARMEGMLYASVEHPPVLGGKVKSYDDKAALQVEGVKRTMQIPPFKPPHAFQLLGGIAVLADNTWAAFQGRKKLKVVWDNGPNASYDSEAYKKELQEVARKPGKVVRNIGDVDAAFAKGGKIVEAEYYVPHLAHVSSRIGQFPRWQGGGLDLYAKSPGSATDRGCRTGHPQGKCHLPCDFAWRRLWKEIEARLCGRGGDFVEGYWTSNKGGMEQRRRRSVRLLSRGRGHVHEGCAG